ncbi:hypothetical protein K458DRAFT_412279 [Lentithecium fluviatile CBS 122367]|uniref:Uncharacterized protein n=1 Tax=Lentithecium fluviatile CBS 122367 TaxID=1168545 RepID=A0A6G1JK74_9PLEO|nr:hypothetical protein K458DRAFT_412279 [Lentithecium fluviatile CBS 122367]
MEPERSHECVWGCIARILRGEAPPALSPVHLIGDRIPPTRIPHIPLHRNELLDSWAILAMPVSAAVLCLDIEEQEAGRPAVALLLFMATPVVR